jgi:hypothetical protein
MNNSQMILKTAVKISALGLVVVLATYAIVWTLLNTITAIIGLVQ